MANGIGMQCSVKQARQLTRQLDEIGQRYNILAIGDWIAADGTNDPIFCRDGVYATSIGYKLVRATIDGVDDVPMRPDADSRFERGHLLVVVY